MENCPTCQRPLIQLRVPAKLWANPDREEDWKDGGPTCIACGPPTIKEGRSEMNKCTPHHAVATHGEFARVK